MSAPAPETNTYAPPGTPDRPLLTAGPPYPDSMLRPLLVTLALTATLVGTPGAAHAGPAAEYAEQAVKATNAAREANDRRPLKVNECLRGFAVKQARAMAAAEEIYHQDLGAIMDACGLMTAGENVAYGYPTGKAVVNQGWMRSEGHRANILSRSFRLVAVAARRDDDGTWYAAQVFGRRP